MCIMGRQLGARAISHFSSGACQPLSRESGSAILVARCRPACGRAALFSVRQMSLVDASARRRRSGGRSGCGPMLASQVISCDWWLYLHTVVLRSVVPWWRQWQRRLRVARRLFLGLLRQGRHLRLRLLLWWYRHVLPRFRQLWRLRSSRPVLLRWLVPWRLRGLLHRLRLFRRHR